MRKQACISLLKFTREWCIAPCMCGATASRVIRSNRETCVVSGGSRRAPAGMAVIVQCSSPAHSRISAIGRREKDIAASSVEAGAEAEKSTIDEARRCNTSSCARYSPARSRRALDKLITQHGWQDSNNVSPWTAGGEEGVQGRQNSAQDSEPDWSRQRSAGWRTLEWQRRWRIFQCDAQRWTGSREETQGRRRAGKGGRQDQLAQRARGDRLSARRRHDPHAG